MRSTVAGDLILAACYLIAAVLVPGPLLLTLLFWAIGMAVFCSALWSYFNVSRFK